MKYLSFDIETAKITSDDEDFMSQRPFGISCYAIAWPTDKYGVQTKVSHGVKADGTPSAQMSRQECIALVNGLISAAAKGYVILAHNGVSFDLSVLAEESGLYKECAELAMNSVDPCLQIHCMKGYPLGLDAIARGMKLAGKPEGMNGSMAPKMWADGNYEEVLAYVTQDVRVALDVVLAVEKRGGLSWITKTGKLSSLPIRRWLTASEALKLPEPDTSWMDSARPRSHFTAWMDLGKIVG